MNANKRNILENKLSEDFQYPQLAEQRGLINLRLNN